MKRIIGIVLATACLLGCKQELHDPLLRQQLTTIVSSLNDENASTAQKAMAEIEAILSVNSAKMSEEQSNKLSSARLKLNSLSSDLTIRGWNKVSEKKMKGVLDKDVDSEIDELVNEAKKALSEVAATF